MSNISKKCTICQNEFPIENKIQDPSFISVYMSNNQICSRVKTKFCAKHQRKFAHSIKRMREMKLIP